MNTETITSLANKNIQIVHNSCPPPLFDNLAKPRKGGLKRLCGVCRSNINGSSVNGHDNFHQNFKNYVRLPSESASKNVPEGNMRVKVTLYASFTTGKVGHK